MRERLGGATLRALGADAASVADGVTRFVVAIADQRELHLILERIAALGLWLDGVRRLGDAAGRCPAALPAKT